MAQTLTEIKSLLAAHGLRPKHRLGQNFLHDGNQMRRILDAAAITSGDVVLEVGPGTGALTERLLEADAHVIAVEIDTDLEPVLTQRFTPIGDRFQLIVGDILAGKHVLNPTVIDALRERPFKLIANLPYNIASPLLVNLAVDMPRWQSGIVMVQREVADRLVASPGTRDYGPISVMMQAMCEVTRLFVVPPGCFWPSPKVDSAVVQLRRRDEPLTLDAHRLATTVQRLFQQRRKQLGAILGADAALPAGVQRDARPESLTVEQFVQLSQYLTAEG